jgi:hypothetical protein
MWREAVRLRLWSEISLRAGRARGDTARIVDERWRPLAAGSSSASSGEEQHTRLLLLRRHAAREGCSAR